jgi:hypothetical protein
VAGQAGAGSAANDAIREVGGALGGAIMGSLAARNASPIGQACSEKDGSGQPGI